MVGHNDGVRYLRSCAFDLFVFLSSFVANDHSNVIRPRFLCAGDVVP